MATEVTAGALEALIVILDKILIDMEIILVIVVTVVTATEIIIVIIEVSIT